VPRCAVRAEIDDEDSAAVLAEFLKAPHSEEPLIPQGDGGADCRIRNASCEFGDDSVDLIGGDRVLRLEDI
jgi:hypothetical protein